MAQHHHKESDIFIKEAEGHQRRYYKILELTHSTTKAAGVMLLGAIVALIVANTAFHEQFYEFWHTELMLGFGESHVEMSLAHIINDILMAIFFLLVGLEIKYEMTVGELRDIRQAILPVGAAIGGVLMPIVVYMSFNVGNPDTIMGWGVPTATDIAFALGILALLGSRVPAGVRVFLSTLAVADDIVAILVRCRCGGVDCAHYHESHPYVFAAVVPVGGCRAVVLHLYVRGTFHHRRRFVGVCHSVKFARAFEEICKLVNGTRKRGERKLRTQSAYYWPD